MTKTKFKDIFSFAKKSNLKAGDGLEEGNFPFFTSSPIQFKRFDKAQHFDNALIFGTGGAASIHFCDEPFSTSTDCLVTIAAVDDINIKYVYYYLKGHIYLLQRGFKGAGIEHISKNYIEEIDIPYLPLETQNKIVSLLDKCSALVKKREQTIDLYNDLLKSIFIERFGDPILNIKGWETQPLKNIADIERGKFSPRPRNDPSYFGGNYPFIQTGDINKSNYRLKLFSQTLNEKGIAVSKKFHQGDIVIAIVGATIGATAILQLDTYATDSIIKINSKGYTHNVFLEMLLRFYRQILLDTAPSAARANINLSIVGDLKIITPPLKIQKEYLQFNNDIEKNLEKVLKSYDQILNLNDSLLERVFNGELNFNIDFELDALIKEIDLKVQNNDLSKIVNNKKYLSRLIDKLNKSQFKDQDIYDKAKHGIFQLLKTGGHVSQQYNPNTKSVNLSLKK